MGRLVQAAAQLGDGEGLSYGVASRAELDRLELTPTERMRALLRLADAEQYRRKLAESDVDAPDPRTDPRLTSYSRETSGSSPTR